MDGTCRKKICIFYYLTLFLNVALILITLFIFSNSYGEDRFFVLLLAVTPIFSIIALRKGGDKEERDLKVRIRKAKLRKELDDLKAYDQAM